MQSFAAIRARVQSVDREQPIHNARTLAQIVMASIADRRFTAMLLAAIGIYGVMSYAVSQRAQEIGVRMASGAQTWGVLRLVIGQIMRLSLLGLALGVAAALGLTGWLRTLLYEVSATDPLTFAAIALLLLIVAPVACRIPAQRAMKVDPLIALRTE